MCYLELQQMLRLQPTKVFLVLVAMFSICACVTNEKRLFEDLQTNGFLVCICDDEEGPTGPMVTVKDAESIEMMAEWFRNRPRRSDAIETQILHALQQASVGFLPNVRIETTRFRVSLPMIVDLPVTLETRDKPSDEWDKSSWKARKEDVELTQWMIARTTAEYRSESFRPKIDEWVERNSE
jgi:hypothetical protein